MRVSDLIWRGKTALTDRSRFRSVTDDSRWEDFLKENLRTLKFTAHCTAIQILYWQLKSYYLNSSCLKECRIKSLNLQKFSRAWVLRWSQTGHFTPLSLGCLGGSSLPVMQAPLQSIIVFHRIKTNKRTFMWNWWMNKCEPFKVFQTLQWFLNLQISRAWKSKNAWG